MDGQTDQASVWWKWSGGRGYVILMIVVMVVVVVSQCTALIGCVVMISRLEQLIVIVVVGPACVCKFGR